MTADANPVDFLGRDPDERLLGEDLQQLPGSVGLPEPLPDTPARRRLVAAGATMTGLTLVGGLALAVFGLIDAIIGGSAVVAVAAIVIGIVLAATHWGWVHVAELTANNLEGHRNAALMERRQAWVSQIEPYQRWEVSTSAGEDGTITIVTVLHRPVPRGERTFTFVREELASETHSADEPGAAVAERAELLRRQAAADTARAREDFAAANDAYRHALMARDDEQQRLAALRAASQALSERINEHLRDPPLTE
jgi:hypothetical protein